MAKAVADNANEFISRELDARLVKIETHFNSHAIAYRGPIVDGVDGYLREAIEGRYKQGPANQRLTFILTTEGGYIEVVQRMVDTLRHFYTLVDFVIPDYAYSAGTVLAMSGDAIHMDGTREGTLGMSFADQWAIQPSHDGRR